jgi:hypothetical protein
MVPEINFYNQGKIICYEGIMGESCLDNFIGQNSNYINMMKDISNLLKGKNLDKFLVRSNIDSLNKFQEKIDSTLLKLIKNDIEISLEISQDK